MINQLKKSSKLLRIRDKGETFATKSDEFSINNKRLHHTIFLF